MLARRRRRRRHMGLGRSARAKSSKKKLKPCQRASDGRLKSGYRWGKGGRCVAGKKKK